MLLEEYREELEKEVKVYRDKRSAKKKVLLQREDWHKELRRNAGSTEKKSIRSLSKRSPTPGSEYYYKTTKSGIGQEPQN